MDFRPKGGLLQVVRRMLSSAAFFGDRERCEPIPPPIFRKDPQEDLYAFPTKGFLGAAGRREVLSLIRFQF